MITTERSSSEELPPGPEEYGTETSPQLRIPTPSSPTTEFHNPRRPNEYIAHTQLMQSLIKEPKYPVTDRPKMTETASYLKEADLSQYVPKPDPLKAKRDDKALVRALADPQLQIATPEDNFEALRKLTERRSRAHDAVIKQYNETFYTICDEVEKQVLEASRDVRDKMEKIDREIAQIFVYLNDDEYIIQRDIFEVQDMWKDLETKCMNRKQIITEYCDNLDKIEEDRGSKMKNIYDKVINDLTDIGYMLVPEIHELVEELSHEANLVILSNMKDFADIRSRLLKEDLSLYITSKQNYEKREIEYRILKHNELIKKFLEGIDIDVIVNSDERKQLIKEMRKDQEKIHNEYRLPLLEKINQQHINEVNDEFINYIINTSEDVSNMENEMNENYFYKLQGLNDIVNKMIIDKRQELRFNLHHYEALEKNGLLKECYNKLLELISAKELEEFFLKTGSLKKELLYICEECGKDYMIEEDDRKQLSERLILPLECLTINKIYEESGLMMDKEQCLNTLNKIKAGTRLEIVGLVPLIIKQLETLTHLEIYPEIVLAQLNDIKEQFQQIQEDITINENESQATGMRSMALSLNSRLTSGSQGKRTSLVKSGSRTSITGGKKTLGGGGTRRTSIMSGDPRLAKATSRKSTLSALSRQSKLSKMSAASDAAKKLDIHLIKSLCNRLGMILCVSDLPVEIKQELMNLQNQLLQQEKSNKKIDDEISNKTDEAIKEVRKQMNDFIEAVGINLQEHSFMLSEEVSMIVQFYTKIRDMLKNHAEKNQYIDDMCEDTLTNSLEKYEDNDKEIENKLAALVKLLRESPNLEECDVRFANCLEMLNNIEQFYRDYQIEVVTISRQHPIDGKNECDNYRMNVCNLYDVYPKDKELPQIEVPKPSLPEEEEGEGNKDSGRKRNSKIAKKKSPRSGGSGGKNGNVEEEEEKPETIMQPIPTYGEFEVETSESYYYIKEEDEFLKYNFKHGYKEEIEKKKAEEERIKEEARLKAEEEARLLEEAKHKKKAPPAKSIKKGKQAEPEPEPEPEPESEPIEIEEKKEVPIQIDTDGKPCVLQLEIPYDGLKSMIEVSRNNLLNFYHNELEERMAKLEALCKKRVKTFTKELEDRLRHHWPRRGRIETENKIPREAEILNHHQKYQRFIRLLVEKNSNHENHYNNLMKEYRKELDCYKQYMKQLEDALPTQSNLSSLEGIHTRARQVKDKLMKKSKECHNGLINYTKIEPDKLRESCDQYIKESILFKNGGDYDDEEVASDRKGFDEWLEGLTETVKEREDNVNILTEAEKRELDKFPEFDKLVEKYVLEISLRDGVGVKYGAPRRRLSEKLRSEITRCNKLKEEIEVRMDGIKQLLQIEPGVAMIPSLSEELLKKLYELRTKIYYYSLYMDVLKNDNIVEMTKLCLKDLDPKNEETGEIDEEQLVDPKFVNPEYKFMPYVMEAIEVCKEETAELYASVGRQDLLSGNGLPESLINFVQGIQDKAQNYRDDTSISFREDMDKLLLLLNQVSYIVFNDLIKRIKENCNEETKNVKKNYNEYMKESDSKRNKNELALKPDLGSKNCIDKLEALMKEEEERQNEEIKYIKKSRKTVIKAVHNQSIYFKNSFFHLFTTMLSIMDNLIYRCDFKPLPGDENIIPPKNGMKILMQLEKQKEEGKYIEPIRMREKLWNGVDLSKLMTVPENIEDALKDDDDDDDKEEENRSESRKSRKSTINKKGKSTPASPVKKSKAPSPKKKSTKSGNNNNNNNSNGLHIDIPEAEEGFSENIGSFGASCQRECAKLRNELYEKFCDEYINDISNSDEFYKKELQRVDSWKNNWMKLIDLLKKTHEEK